MVKEARARGYRAEFYPVIELLARLRASYGDQEEFADERDHTLLSELAELDLLVLDDLERAKATACWATVSRLREMTGRPLIVRGRDLRFVSHDDLDDDLVIASASAT